MAFTVAVYNGKGGVAKTTTCRNLSYALASRDLRVLAVDLDPQANLSMISGLDRQALRAERRTIYHVLIENRPVSEVIVQAGTFDVVCSTRELTDGAKSLLVDEFLGGGHALRDALRLVQDRYDVIMIDCGPGHDILTMNALTAADRILIPQKVDELSIDGMTTLFEIVKKVKERINPTLRILGILPSHYRTGVRHHEAALGVLNNLKGVARVFEPIPLSTDYENAHSQRVSVLQANPNARGAHVYYDIADAIEEERSYANA